LEVTVKQVEFLYWEGCPSHEEALALLHSVLDDRGVALDVDIRRVNTLDEAQEFRFPGSPTIRVDGRDVDPEGADERPSLTCRIYRLEDGRPSPVPSRKQLEDALQ
jgi:hypothetical protein